MLRRLCSVLILALTTLAPGVARADEDNGRGEMLFVANLVRVADMNADQIGAFFNPAAGDPLAEGLVEVRRKREVEAVVRGAAQSATYRVFFCRLGFGPDRCDELGTFETDSQGNGRGRLPFNLAAANWSGVFLLARDVTGVGSRINQFVSGFQFRPADQAQTGVEIDLRGSVETVAAGSFRLRGFPVDIFVDASTRFDNVSGLGDLKPGDEVEIEGITRADGTILATRVKIDDDDNGRGRGRGHGHDDDESES